MTTLSEVIREQAAKAGMTVIDVGIEVEISPNELQGIPMPTSWDRAGRMMRDHWTLSNKGV
ncbi:TPA: hypothetical protein NV758_001578 [Escherichia coli]|nr:hypothetical protein Ecwhy1_499 [Escherichia phage Ecwhy_1]HCJ8661071.1 hypothetical protein [Escherichia coli]HCJ8666563.1 hypothetical protein [Escherichia coli]HEA3649819.1 hypothetical protein [Escherichia coli]